MAPAFAQACAELEPQVRFAKLNTEIRSRQIDAAEALSKNEENA